MNTASQLLAGLVKRAYTHSDTIQSVPLLSAGNAGLGSACFLLEDSTISRQLLTYRFLGESNGSQAPLNRDTRMAGTANLSQGRTSAQAKQSASSPVVKSNIS